MHDDKTIIFRSNTDSASTPGIKVSYKETASAAEKSRIMTSAFTIGRQPGSTLQINDVRVSRHHAEIYPTAEGWFIRDLGSANGTLLAGKPVNKAMLIKGKCTIQLGHSGPSLSLAPLAAIPDNSDSTFDVDKTLIRRPASKSVPYPPTKANEKSAAYAAADDPESVAEALQQRYFGENENEDMGERTRLLRKIIKQTQKKQSTYYHFVIFTIGLLLLAVSGIAVYQQTKINHARSLAVDIFYTMKSLEVQIAQEEIKQEKSGYLIHLTDLTKQRQQLQAMQHRYRNYLQELDAMRLFKQQLSHEVEMIHQIAGVFGESELMLTDEFISEVQKYIEYWKSNRRLPRAISRMKKSGDIEAIVNALQQQHLPAQYLYLCLQESNCIVAAVGPETRFGFAKGAWQFIPETATQYGLKIGPLANTNEYDPADERFDFAKATLAAARYLKDLYSNEAQASGLLVMASYNWGDKPIRRLIQKLPDTPRERNFWQLIKKYKIPQETYDYVFYIFSAAVIGEDPKHFGFSFENPLQQ
jgi:peptidoglycan lytic transglycosylase D